MNNLKKFRKSLNLKQYEIAEKLGLPRTTYQSYEQGVNEPSITNLLKMADFFGVSTDSILGHDANIIDLNAVSENQKFIVETIIKNLDDNQISEVVGFIKAINKK